MRANQTLAGNRKDRVPVIPASENQNDNLLEAGGTRRNTVNMKTKKTTAEIPLIAQTPRFKIGDWVTFTNDQGVRFSGKTIIEIMEAGEYWGRAEKLGFVYFYAPSDSPWFPAREDQLGKETR